MRHFCVLFLLLAALCPLAACAAKKPKSSAHIYAGDAPTIRFNDRPETAGGRINTY